MKVSTTQQNQNNANASAKNNFPFATVVFDLDGTLVDSLADVTNAVNHVLADFGLAPIDERSRRALMGEGAKIRVRTAFQMRGETLTEEELNKRTGDFNRYYSSCFLNETRPYDGANELLLDLAQRGVRTAVCTNKDELSARAILTQLKLMPPIEDVAGPDTFGIQKPNPRHLLCLLERMNVTPQSAIFVGDSVHDVKTARAAGVSVAIVDWGYSAQPAEQMGADYVLRRFGDLMRIAVAA